MSRSTARSMAEAAARPTRDRLRVAQIVTTMARGGAQATVLASRDMAGHGVDVTVLAGPDDPGEGTYWGALSSAAIDETRPIVVVPRLRRALSPLDDVRALCWLVIWLRANRPDVVHTHSSKAGVIGRLAASIVGIPAVHTVHGWNFDAVPEEKTSVRSRLGRRAIVTVERLMARLSAAMVVVSARDEEHGLEAGIGTKGSYHLVRSGIDLETPRLARLRRDAIREELGLDDRFVVGTVARLAPQKDLLTLVTGFSRAGLGSGTLVIVGSGPDEALLRSTAEDLGVGGRVVFLGQRDDAATLVAAFDVFVLTSRWEGLPRALVEAMAAEVPVVATPVGGVTELVRPGATGTLLPVGDPAALADVLVEHREARSSYRTMAEEASAVVEGFSADEMQRALALVWHQAAGRADRRDDRAQRAEAV